MGFLIVVALIGLAISGGTFLAYQVMLNFHPGPARVKTEIAKLMASFDSVLPDLVPINKKEIELFSHSQIDRNQTGGISKTARGIVISIYEEPMIAYVYKRYTGKSENAVLLARTVHQEMFFRIRNEQVQVSLNNQAVGIIEKNGVLYSPGNYKPLAHIDKKGNQQAFPIMVEGKEVASLLRDDPSIKVHQRALQFVGNLTKREELFLLIMMTWELTRKGIDD